MASEVLERVPRERLSVAGVSKGVGSVTKSVVSSSIAGSCRLLYSPVSSVGGLQWRLIDYGKVSVCAGKGGSSRAAGTDGSDMFGLCLLIIVVQIDRLPRLRIPTPFAHRNGHVARLLIVKCFAIFLHKVMESKHNYEALTNEVLFLEISGAPRMTVTFDERSRTEDR